MSLRSKKAFTLIELLVVIAIIALLLSILMPALTKVKKQAQAAICLSNIKQWGTVFTMYAGDNNESFPQNFMGGSLSHYDAYWCHATMNYYKDESLRFCPSAKRNKDRIAEVITNPSSQGMIYGMTFMNWGPFADKDTVTPANWWDEYPEGSYGMNEWCSSPVEGNWAYIPDDDPKFWRKTNKVSKASTVPLFMDLKLTDTYPLTISSPPLWPDDKIPDGAMNYVYDPMEMACMDRHSGGVNIVFMDASARKVFLKELWKLKWQIEFDTRGQWTTAGGATRASWPDWMTTYKEF